MRIIADCFGMLGAAFCRFIPVQDKERSKPPMEEARHVWAITDPLEQRSLLSCSLSGTVVTCNGTSGNNTFTVYQENGVNFDELNIEIDGSDPDWNYDSRDVTRIDINAGAGVDVLQVGVTGNDYQGDEAVGVPVSVSGGDGNDWLEGGEQADTIRGEEGSDNLFGFQVADVLYGAYGDDTIDGGDGNDVIYGGPDDDSITGGGGGDLMLGEEGYDDFHAQDGEADTVDGGADDDTVLDDDPSDVLSNI